ncbi:pyridoxal phosphate-dependent aminotransferase [Dactylosporangium sp. NPDC051485]|uniref:pyridoxal phosphate-dependent aminotransferase n=1 Tax=Dactylosporangium sp. NPDC051485 TaxID=3154846 RepID=UPI00344A678C
MRPAVSRRAAAVVAHSYDDFPVRAGDVDLRADGTPPLRSTVSALQRRQPGPAVTLGYGDIAGEWSLRSVLADLFGVTPGEVVVTGGASEALHLALTCITDPGGSVLLPTPAFPGYTQLAELLAVTPTYYPVPGVPPVRDATTPMVICAPHNPTGIVVPRRPAGPAGAGTGTAWTVWDVSHIGLTAPERAWVRSVVTATSVVVFSLSKLLRLPGVRIGCLITQDRALHDAVIRVKTHLSMSTGRLGQHLAAEILTDPDTSSQLAERHARLTHDRSTLTATIAASRTFTVVPATGGSHLLLHTRDGRDAAEALRKAGIVGIPGVVFGAGHDAVRICVAQPADVIDHARERLDIL